MQENVLEKHLKELEEILLKRRKEDFERLLAEDFIEFGSSGNVYSKQDQLDAFDSPTGNKLNAILSDFRMNRLSSDISQVTYKIHNLDTDHHTLRSSLWRLNHDSWQMFFHQGTITKTDNN